MEVRGKKAEIANVQRISGTIKKNNIIIFFIKNKNRYAREMLHMIGKVDVWEINGFKCR